jgi:hypothetical protein
MLKYLLAAVAAITVIASAHAAEDEVREAAPIGLVGEPWPPGSEQQATVWMEPPPVGSPGGVYGGELPVLVTSGTWATPSQLSGGVPSYMPAGYDVTTVPALWADSSVPLPTPNPLKANALQLPAQNCPQPTAEADARECQQQQANTAAIKEDALAAKDAAVLSAHAEAKPKRTRTHKH